MKSPAPALFLLHGAVMLFGGAGVLGGLVTAPPEVTTAARSLIAAAVLGAWQLGPWRGHPAPRRPWTATSRGGVGMAGALLAVHWWAFFAAVQWGSVTLGLLTFASYPLFALALEPWVYRERLRVADAVAAVAVVAGLACAVDDWNFAGRAGRAAWLGLASGLTFALLGLLNRRLLRERPAIELVAAETGVAGLLLLPWVVGLAPAIPARDWPVLVLLGGVFTGLAHWAFTAALTRVPVRVAGVTAALEPVYGVALATLLLGEPLPARVLLGGGLLVGAAMLAAGTPTAPARPGPALLRGGGDKASPP